MDADRIARVLDQDPVARATQNAYIRLKGDMQARRILAAEGRPPVTADYLPEHPSVTRPTLLPGLLYPAEVHWLFGAPGMGKTWLAYWAAAQVARDGGNVWLLDYEMSADTVAERMRLLGVTDRTQEFWKIQRSEYPIFVAPEDFEHHLDDFNPALVIIDSFERLAAAHGSAGRAAQDTMSEVEALFIQPAKRHGTAVLVIDHVTKADAADALRPVNSGAKEAAATVLYRLGDGKSERIQPGRAVSLPLYVPTKDRHGQIETVPGAHDVPVAGTFTVSDADVVFNPHAAPQTADLRKRAGAAHGPAPVDTPEHRLTCGNTPERPRTKSNQLAASANVSSAASVMENVARLVAAAGGKLALSADEWGERCGMPARTMSRLLTREAPAWGLTVRRYRAGHAGTRMIDVRRRLAVVA